MNKHPSLKFSSKNAQKLKPPILTMVTEPSESIIPAMLKDSQSKLLAKLTPIPKIRTEPTLDSVFNLVLSHLPVQTTGLSDWMKRTIATQLSVLQTIRIFGFFIDNLRCLMPFSSPSTPTSKKMVSMSQTLRKQSNDKHFSIIHHYSKIIHLSIKMSYFYKIKQQNIT